MLSKNKNYIKFPEFTSLRCLMMPYIQGESESLPDKYQTYSDIIENVFIKRGDVGYLTIDESFVIKGKPHRGDRAKTNRALHTEAGKLPDKDVYLWGGVWGGSNKVTLDSDVEIIIASNIDNTCAVWNVDHPNTSLDGDIGFAAKDYPYSKGKMLVAGEICKIGILTPHESLPVKENVNRQFLRIISSGVHGRESYFTKNPLMSI